MKSPREIAEALQVIKDVCEEAEYCGACPLRIEGLDCGIKNGMPKWWEVNLPDEWKAF